MCVFNFGRNRSEKNTCYILDSLYRGKDGKQFDNKIGALLLYKESVIIIVVNSEILCSNKEMEQTKESLSLAYVTFLALAKTNHYPHTMCH